MQRGSCIDCCLSQFVRNSWAQTISDAIGLDENSSVFPERATWNGKDWYVAFGDDETRSWDDAMKYGFVSAGGGDWYSRTLRNVPQGAQIFTYIPQSAYVVAGEVTGPAQLFEDSFLAKEGDLKVTYVHSNGETEYILPVRWSKVIPIDEGLKALGLFANQKSSHLTHIWVRSAQLFAYTSASDRTLCGYPAQY